MIKHIPWPSAILFLYLSWIGEGFAYEMFWWWDLMLHTWAGWLIMRWGMLTFPLENTFSILFLSSLVVNFLVSWELFEWLADTYLAFNMQKDGIKDTMEDILVGKLGVAAYCCFHYMKGKMYEICNDDFFDEFGWMCGRYDRDKY